MKAPSFSIILPTHNRAYCICNAVDSVLKQTYQKFELIIVDDGSTDGTDKMLNQRYAKHLDSGKIIYKKIQKSGVCKARNEGLKLAKNEWIAYIDSDNTVYSYFLGVFATQIMKNPKTKNFYAQYQIVGKSNAIDWKNHNFSIERLYHRNFIDLGVYVHHKSLISLLGGFDESMKRLVDWDLILRQCSIYIPKYISSCVMKYCNDKRQDRITNVENNVHKWIDYVHKKNRCCAVNKSMTTVIIAYNQQSTICQCIESALKQKGDFTHVIIIMDDCSTDDTYKEISKYKKIKNVIVHRSYTNIGQAQILKKALSLVNTKYVSILEGDDYWINDYNLNEKIHFLESYSNLDCSLVFSKIKIYDAKHNKFCYARAQMNIIGNKISEQQVLSIHGINPICNYSCCVFKTSILKTISDEVFVSDKKLVSEIAIGFLCLKFGKFGFINKELTIYRMHNAGQFTGADDIKRLELMINARKQALMLCSQHAKKPLNEILVNIQKDLQNAKNSISMHS